MLFWDRLTREQDYAFQRPWLTREKLRGLELSAGGAERHPGRRDLATRGAYSARAERATSVSSPNKRKSRTAGCHRRAGDRLAETVAMTDLHPAPKLYRHTTAPQAA